MDDMFMYRLGQKRGGGGGKPAVIEPLNVTENGTYTPDAGVDGFSPVTVNVQASGGDDWYITDASYLFYQGARLDAKDALLPRLKDLTKMRYMFSECSTLTELDVSNIDTSKVTDMTAVLSNCTNLVSVDISSWDTSKIANIYSMQNMFSNCFALTEIIGFSATAHAGYNLTFPTSSSPGRCALKRLTFRTDLPDRVYSIRSAINIKNCAFGREGMVEMFNTLPDLSNASVASTHKTITITGNPCVIDGTLTAEDETIATSKGWTLVK